jgi:hypothetical protein
MVVFRSAKVRFTRHKVDRNSHGRIKCTFRGANGDHGRFLFSFFAIVALLCGQAPAVETKPNILLIFADDLGWQEPGFAGSDFMETPRLDQLAGQGTPTPLLATVSLAGLVCFPVKPRRDTACMRSVQLIVDRSRSCV